MMFTLNLPERDFEGSAHHTVGGASANEAGSAYACATDIDQSTLAYAGRIVEAHADTSDVDAVVCVSKGTERHGPTATTAEMIRAST